MKKNLLTVVILALVLVNLILTAILTISILPQTKKANELITQVCAAIDLELNSGDNATNAINIPIDQVATHDIPEMTVNLKNSADGTKHYASLSVSISMDKDSDGYKSYGESLPERESLIKSTITTVVSGYTYEEFNADQTAVQTAIRTELQRMFDSDFIISVGFPTVTSQ